MSDEPAKNAAQSRSKRAPICRLSLKLMRIGQASVPALAGTVPNGGRDRLAGALIRRDSPSILDVRFWILDWAAIGRQSKIQNPKSKMGGADSADTEVRPYKDA